MISRPQNCVLIALDEAMDPVTEEELKETVSDMADHGMIYNSSNSKVYHSSLGTYQSGVRSHEPPLLQSQEEIPFGNMIVFNIKDSQVRENLIDVIVRWDATHDPVAYKKIKEKQQPNQILKLPTPFVDFHRRPADPGTPEENARLELYRAFRAHERNRLNLPLSKEKGVSCGNFVSYAMKVAVIKRLFPEGLPKEIQDKLSEIENKKTKDNRKLALMNPADFEDFEKIVLKHLPPGVDAFLKELNRPVKNKSVSEFCHGAFENSALYDFAGYIFIRKINEKPEFWVMPHDVYVKFIDKYPENGSVITDEQLNSLNLLGEVKIHVPFQQEVEYKQKPEVYVDQYCNQKIKELESRSWSHFFSAPPIGKKEYEYIKTLSHEEKIFISAAMKHDPEYLEKYHFMVKKAFATPMRQFKELEKSEISNFNYKSQDAKKWVADIKKAGEEFTDKGIAEIFTNLNHSNRAIFKNEQVAKHYAEGFKKYIESSIKTLNDFHKQEIASLSMNRPNNIG